MKRSDTGPKASNVVQKLSGAWISSDGEPEARPVVRAVPETKRTLGLQGRMVVEVPIPPSVNALYRSRAIPTKRKNRFGHTIHICTVYMTNEGKAWKAEAAKVFMEKGFRYPDDAKVVCEAYAFWPDRRARDMNNLAKVTCDALQESGVVVDDKRVLWREMEYFVDKENPRLRLEVYILGSKE